MPNRCAYAGVMKATSQMLGDFDTRAAVTQFAKQRYTPLAVASQNTKDWIKASEVHQDWKEVHGHSPLSRQQLIGALVKYLPFGENKALVECDAGYYKQSCLNMMRLQTRAKGDNFVSRADDLNECMASQDIEHMFAFAERD